MKRSERVGDQFIKEAQQMEAAQEALKKLESDSLLRSIRVVDVHGVITVIKRVRSIDMEDALVLKGMDGEVLAAWPPGAWFQWQVHR